MSVDGRRLVFLGTPHAAAVVLERLLDAGVPVAHVVTRPDAKRGRGSATTPSPVKEVALARGIEVSHDLSWIMDNCDTPLLGLVVAYGRIIPEDLLRLVPMINVHFSLLPRWRGAAPVERAILAGDAETGVCIMQIEPTLDTGAVYATARVPITDTCTTESLTRQLADAGAELLIGCLARGLGEPVPQPDGATHAAKISREELRVDWSRSARDVHRLVRAVRAHTLIDGSRLRLLEITVVDDGAGLAPGEMSSDAVVGTGDGAVRLVRVQPEGKAPMDAQAWLRGRTRIPGSRFQ